MSMFIQQKIQQRSSSFTKKKQSKYLTIQFPSLPLPSKQQVLKKLQTYNSYSTQQLKQIFQSHIEMKKFKSLVCDALKFNYLYQPIFKTLNDEMLISYGAAQIKVSDILGVILENRFYRHFPKDNQFTVIENSKSTHINLKCLVAGLMAYSSSKLSIMEIEHIIKVLSFEQKLAQTHPYGLPLDSQRLFRILKKLCRAIKPMDFKQWLQDFKSLTNSETIQNYQFLYLLNLTEQRGQPNSYMFMTTKKNQQQMVLREVHQFQIENRTRLKQNKQDRQQGQKDVHHNLLIQQKNRMRSFSYQAERKSLQAVKNYNQIKQNIRKSQEELVIRKKSSTLVARINSKHHINQNQRHQDKRITLKSKHSLQKQKKALLLIPKQKSPKKILSLDQAKINRKFFDLTNKQILKIDNRLNRLELTRQKEPEIKHS